MELVLKIPRDKPPFIGILFPQYLTHDAKKENTDLIYPHNTSPCRIILEPLKEELNIRLICEEKVTVRFYSHIKYNPTKLKDWLYLTQKATKFNFAHLDIEYDRHIVLKELGSKRNIIFHIESVRLISEE